MNQPELFKDDFRLANLLYASVDQPAIYRTQVKVTKKTKQSGNKEVDRKPYCMHFNKIYKI